MTFEDLLKIHLNIKGWVMLLFVGAFHLAIVLTGWENLDFLNTLISETVLEIGLLVSVVATVLSIPTFLIGFVKQNERRDNSTQVNILFELLSIVYSFCVLYANKIQGTQVFLVLYVLLNVFLFWTLTSEAFVLPKGFYIPCESGILKKLFSATIVRFLFGGIALWCGLSFLSSMS